VNFKLGDYAHLLVSGDYMQENDHADGFHYLGWKSLFYAAGFRVWRHLPGQFLATPRILSGPITTANSMALVPICMPPWGAVDFQSISGYRYSYYRLLTDILGAGIPVGGRIHAR